MPKDSSNTDSASEDDIAQQ